MSSGTGAIKERWGLKCIQGHGHGGNHGNPGSANHQAPSHWKNQWTTYLPILTRNNDWEGRNGGEGSAKIAENERIHNVCTWAVTALYARLTLKAPKGHPLDCMPKGESPLAKHIVSRLTLPNIISHIKRINILIFYLFRKVIILGMKYFMSRYITAFFIIFCLCEKDVSGCQFLCSILGRMYRLIPVAVSSFYLYHGVFPISSGWERSFRLSRTRWTSWSCSK